MSRPAENEEKDRERDREHEREKTRARDKDRDRERDRDRDRERDRDRDRDRAKVDCSLLWLCLIMHGKNVMLRCCNVHAESIQYICQVQFLLHRSKICPVCHRQDQAQASQKETGKSLLLNQQSVLKELDAP